MTRFWLPTLSAVLLYLSFYPANLGPVAWGALVPLICYALREPSGRRVFFASWLGGAVFFIAAFFWVRHTAAFGPWGIGVYMGLYWALFGLILRRLCLVAGWPVPVAAPVAWVTLEYVRGYLVGGLPYVLVGYTQHEALGVIQVADLGGVWLVSMLVLFVNGAAAEAILRPQGTRTWSAAALASVVLALAYGEIRLASLPEESGPVVGIVQPNIPQDVKDVGRFDPKEGRRIFDKHVRMSRELVERSPGVALVLWPESVLQAGLNYHPSSDRWLRTSRFELLAESARSIGRPLIVGVLVDDILRPGDKSAPEASLLTDLDPDTERESTNSALLFDAQGRVAARYDKIGLVQFTECMPFEPWIPVKKFVAGVLNVRKVYEFRRGREAVTFDVAGRTFGVCICSENYYPDIWRKIARKGASAIVNISNEAWFRESAELDLMRAMTRFRAVENRVACVRAANSGISEVLDAGGRPVGTLEGPGGALKSVEGTMAVGVPAGPGGSPYGRVGDAVVWMAAGATLAGLAWSAFLAKR